VSGDTLAIGVVAAVAVASLCVKRPSGSRTVAPAAAARWYHASPAENRSSIQSRGLLTAFDQGMGWTPAGVYFTQRPPIDTDYDVWEADLSGFTLLPDPFCGEETDLGDCVYVEHDVVPSRLRLFRRGSQRRGSLALDELARRRMPRADFVFPQDRSFPIHDHMHGQKALIYAMTPSNEMRRYRVMRDVFGRYPDLQAWWNTTEKGRLDPANRNSWQTTLLKYRALLQRTTDAAEAADLRGEIAALTDLVSKGARRAA